MTGTVLGDILDNATHLASLTQTPSLGSHASHDHDDDHHPRVILFLAVTTALGALAKGYLYRIAIPHTILMFVMGVIFGAISLGSSEWRRYMAIQNMNPHLIFYIFLPPLIFESAYNCDTRVFTKVFWQSILLAGPGLLIGSTLIALFSRLVYPEWPWSGAFLFGAIVSATDPVAVVALLRELGCSKKIATLIEGESLLNDGTAIVLFSLLKDAVETGSFEGGAMGIILSALKLVCLGVVTGFVIGWMTNRALEGLFNEPVVEIILTLSAAYITFYVAEGIIGCSGVLALVTLGVFLGDHKASVSPEVEHALHEFWEVLVFIANTIIFVLLGLIVLERLMSSEIVLLDFLYLGLIFLCLNVIRLVVVFINYPIISCFQYSLTPSEAFLVALGGLRGAVGVVLALFVAFDSGISDAHGNYGAKVAFQVAGVAVGTLIINGMLTKPVVTALDLNAVTDTRKLQVREAFQSLQLVQDTHMQILKQDRFLVNCNWDWVKKLALDGLTDPHNGDNDLSLLRASVAVDQEAYQAYYRAFKLSIKRNLEEGIISPWVHKQLIHAADEAAEAGTFIDQKVVRTSMTLPLWLRVCLKFSILRWIFRYALFTNINAMVMISFGFVFGQEDVLKHKDHFVVGHSPQEAEAIIAAIANHANNEREAVLKHIQLIRESFPNILMAVKTRVVSREVLNKGREHIRMMKAEGAMDQDDGEILIHMLESKMKALISRCPMSIDPEGALDMLRHNWLYQAISIPKVGARLSRSTTEISFQRGDAVYRTGDLAEVHFVVDGIVKRHFKDHTFDHVGPGQWLGLKSTVTETQHCNDCICETRVTCLTIKASDFQSLMAQDSKLENYVWTVCGRDWARRLLHNTRPYRDWSHFKRSRWLMDGNILELVRRGDKGHVEDIKFESVSVRLQSGHTYVLVHGQAKAQRRHSLFHRNTTGKHPGNQSFPHTDLNDSSFDPITLGNSMRPTNSRLKSRYTGPCLLPSVLKVVQLSPNARLFHLPTSDGYMDRQDHDFQSFSAEGDHEDSMEASYYDKSPGPDSQPASRQMSQGQDAIQPTLAKLKGYLRASISNQPATALELRPVDGGEEDKSSTDSGEVVTRTCTSRSGGSHQDFDAYQDELNDMPTSYDQELDAPEMETLSRIQSTALGSSAIDVEMQSSSKSRASLHVSIKMDPDYDRNI